MLKSGPDHIRVVYRLKNSPVANVSAVLRQLFQAEGGLHKSGSTSAKGSVGSSIAIAHDVITNSFSSAVRLRP